MSKSVFTGKDDNGNKIIFDVKDTDSNKSIDLTFNNTIRISGGCVSYKNAPFGASLNVSIINPLDNSIIRTFVDDVFLYGDGIFDLYADSTSNPIPQGLIIRITVNNGTTASNFKCVGHLRLVT